MPLEFQGFIVGEYPARMRVELNVGTRERVDNLAPSEARPLEIK